MGAAIAIPGNTASTFVRSSAWWRYYSSEFEVVGLEPWSAGVAVGVGGPAGTGGRVVGGEPGACGEIDGAMQSSVAPRDWFFRMKILFLTENFPPETQCRGEPRPRTCVLLGTVGTQRHRGDHRTQLPPWKAHGRVPQSMASDGDDGRYPRGTGQDLYRREPRRRAAIARLPQLLSDRRGGSIVPGPGPTSLSRPRRSSSPPSPATAWGALRRLPFVFELGRPVAGLHRRGGRDAPRSCTESAGTDRAVPLPPRRRGGRADAFAQAQPS